MQPGYLCILVVYEYYRSVIRQVVSKTEAEAVFSGSELFDEGLLA